MLELQDMTKALHCQLMDKKFKKADKVKFLGVIIDENLTWDDQIKHLENKLLSTTYCTYKKCKKVYPILTLFKNVSILICITSYLWHFLLGKSILFQLHKSFNIQKRCIRILFGESYSFDHPEYYATCCRNKMYQEHVALKEYALEHTKPLFNKHSLLTLHKGPSINYVRNFPRFLDPLPPMFALVTNLKTPSPQFVTFVF